MTFYVCKVTVYFLGKVASFAPSFDCIGYNNMKKITNIIN